ncbi:MAG: MucBP domain-containing protein [bacterium]|nr:MucBP domain-containing protein [bacterium]
MKISGDFFRKKKEKIALFVAPAVILAGLFTSGKIWAESRVGDFVNNVKTTLTVLDKENGAEKVNFLSGETMTFSSRIEITSDGGASSYPGAYLLIKFPKEYAASAPVINSTDLVTSSSNVDTDTHYVKRLNYKNLIAGSINSINSQYRLKIVEAPAGYKPEVIHELYSADGNLLSRQTKSVNTTKSDLNAATYKSKVGTSNTHYIARYTDHTNSTIDKNSYETMGVMEFSITNNITYPSGSSYGKKEITSAFNEYVVPEYMEVHQDSLADGWTFDPNTRIARKNLSIISGKSNVSGAKIKLYYTKNTDDSIINKTVEHNHKLVVEVKDNPPVEGTHNLNIRVMARRVSGEDKLTASKMPLTYGNGYRYVANKFVYNINTISNDGDWRIALRIRNDGDGVRVPLSRVEDSIPDELKFTSITLRPVDVFFGVGNENAVFQVFLYKKDGSKIMAGEIKKSTPSLRLSAIAEIEDYRRVEIVMPEGYQLPDALPGQDSYGVDLDIDTDFKDIDEYANSLEFNAAPTEQINRAKVYSSGKELTIDASKYYEKIASKVVNKITPGRNKVTYTVGDYVDFYDLYSAMISNSGVSINKLKNPRRAILYSPDFSLTPQVRQKIAEGVVEYHENYKNTGRSAIIDLKPNSGTSEVFAGINRNSLFSVSEATPNGKHKFELVTFWDDSDKNYIGTEGLDDLDFNNDGKQSRNVARSTANIIVLKPEQVAIKKYIRAKGSDFTKSIDKLDPGQEIDYRLSVINTSDHPLLASRILEVLPKVGDKKIVEGNNGVQESRGSTTGVKITGPIAPRDGFTILYSTDEPGNNQKESWSKNFITADKIADWSAVRMIKIQQNQGYQVPPQTVVNFVINAKIDDNAADGSIAKNTAAVSISSGGNLVESDPVSAIVNYPIKIQGVAFMDTNNNSLFDQGVDTILPNYRVEILRNNTVVADLLTNDRGEYSYSTKDWGANFSVRFTRPNGIDSHAILVPARNQSNGSTPTSERDNVATTSDIYLNSQSNKVQNRNIGLYIPKGSLRVVYRYTTNPNGGLPYSYEKSSEVVIDTALIGTPYDVRSKRLAQISDGRGLVYEFEEVGPQAPEVGAIKNGETIVFFYYKPKLGSPVKARYVDEQDRELKSEVVVKPDRTQVGTEYASTKDSEITKDNLVYIFKQLKNGSAPERGRVSENEQIVTYVYAPKQGGSVKSRFVDERGQELSAEVEVKPRGTQVGVEYSSSKQNEIQKNGLTYTFKQLGQGSASENGRVKAEDQVVTYVYTPKLGGSVTAKFVNQDGVSIKPDEVLKADQTQIGTQYTSSYPNEIIATDGITYVFEKIIEGSAPREGRVNGEAQVITYRYVPKKGGAVIAEFIAKTGEKLKTDEVVKSTDTPVGTSYTANKDNELTKNNLVYVFESLKQGSAPETGKVKAESQTVTYVYTPKLGGKVDAKFLDENGVEIRALQNISPDRTQVGTSYSSTPPAEITFNDIVYVYKELGGNSAPQNGRVSENPQTISYIYTPKRGGSVIVNFVNEAGDSIKETEILKPNGTPVGTAYNAQEDAEIEKDNLVYVFKELKNGSKPKTGRVSEDSTEVTFVYAPKRGGKVVAKFTTSDGIELQGEEEVSPQDTQVGTEYASTKPEEIEKDGLTYIFKELKEGSAPEEGRVKVDLQTINYIYEPKLGDAVSMRFVDTNGVLLGEIKEILPKGKQVGTPYEAKIPETVTVDGKSYRLKIVRSDKGDAKEKGKVSEDPQMITVIFEFIPPVETPNTGHAQNDKDNTGLIAIVASIILSLGGISIFTIKKSTNKTRK